MTKVYYNHPERYQIINFTNEDQRLSGENLVVDTIGDLERLEASWLRLSQGGL